MTVFAHACGPGSVINRAERSGNVDPERPDAGFGVPGGSGMQPPPSKPPGESIDPTRSPDGFRCNKDDDCLSRRCADGVCCETACDGVCRSCDQPANPGRCLPVPGGQDPDDECAEEGPATCGRDGACDGAGACRFHPAGSVCVAAGCEVATEWAPSLCDGRGSCQPGTRKSCAPAVCVGDACAPPCAVDGDCPSGRWCDAGTCRTQREQGAPCERGAQCGSGFCTDGVCCNMACSEDCYSCDQTGALGVCRAIPDGQDPGNECPVEAIGTCGNLGGCNGRGACRKHPMGTFCGYGSCMNTTQYGNSICDGMGGCRRGPARSCGNYSCNGNLVCWTACSSNAQCSPGNACNVHTCE